MIWEVSPLWYYLDHVIDNMEATITSPLRDVQHLEGKTDEEMLLEFGTDPYDECDGVEFPAVVQFGEGIRLRLSVRDIHPDWFETCFEDEF